MTAAEACRAAAEGLLSVCPDAEMLLSGSIVDPDHVLADAFDCVSSINDGDTRPLAELLQPSVARANMSRAALRAQNNENINENIVLQPTYLSQSF